MGQKAESRSRKQEQEAGSRKHRKWVRFRQVSRLGGGGLHVTWSRSVLRLRKTALDPPRLGGRNTTTCSFSVFFGVIKYSLFNSFQLKAHIKSYS